jgi:hypothetical protein
MVKIQSNVNHFGDDKRKWEVGRYLRFLGYDEIAGKTFRKGEIVVPVERNSCGMGIDVRRRRGTVVDMVWPEEVELI